jgi:hypothetical protein
VNERQRPEYEPLKYLTPDGDREELKVVPVSPDEIAASTPLLRQRQLDIDGGGRLVKRTVNPEVGDRDAGIALLENEIRAGVYIYRRFGAAYPAELARLVGHDADAADPFALFEPYRGEQIERAAYQLHTSSKSFLAFYASLFRAVAQLAAARIVHRMVSLESVLWDGASGSVQLIDFCHSAREGEQRTRIGTAPWASPEQLAGTGRADARDDVWSAAMVALWLPTKQPWRGQSPPTKSNLPGLLARIPATVYSDLAADRPDARAVLAVLRPDITRPAIEALAPLPDVVPGFGAGAREFDRIMREKRAPGRDEGGSVRAEGAEPGRNRRRFWP